MLTSVRLAAAARRPVAVAPRPARVARLGVRAFQQEAASSRGAATVKQGDTLPMQQVRRASAGFGRAIALEGRTAARARV
jgi:hypothetical protein